MKEFLRFVFKKLRRRSNGYCIVIIDEFTDIKHAYTTINRLQRLGYYVNIINYI